MASLPDLEVKTLGIAGSFPKTRDVALVLEEGTHFQQWVPLFSYPPKTNFNSKHTTTMIYYNRIFRNYEDFKQIFGIQEHGNGAKNRKNKILLSFIKNPELLRQARKTGDFSLLSIRDMTTLKQILNDKIRRSGVHSKKNPHKLSLMGKTYGSPMYSTDELLGLCEDGTPNAIRYRNEESGRIFKMKAGKLYRHLITSSKFGATLPEPVVNWLCEEFVMDWQTYSLRQLPKNKLYVNDNFKDIYTQERLAGDFHSCMVGRNLHSFYKNAIDGVKAAYLENDQGKIIARCVIFTQVHERDSDRIWRIAERQYATDSNEILKRCLIEALIEAGEIDAYKKVGAGCSDCRAIVDLEGNSLANHDFYIDCHIGKDEPVSFMDTFTYYDRDSGIAANYCIPDYTDRLNTTLGRLDDDEEDMPYSEYTDETCEEVLNVYYHGVCMTCDASIVDAEFILFNGEYRHPDDFDPRTCPRCGRRMLNPTYYANELFRSDAGLYYCSASCRDAAENACQQHQTQNVLQYENAL